MSKSVKSGLIEEKEGNKMKKILKGFLVVVIFLLCFGFTNNVRADKLNDFNYYVTAPNMVDEVDTIKYEGKALFKKSGEYLRTPFGRGWTRTNDGKLYYIDEEEDQEVDKNWYVYSTYKDTSKTLRVNYKDWTYDSLVKFNSDYSVKTNYIEEGLNNDLYYYGNYGIHEKGIDCREVKLDGKIYFLKSDGSIYKDGIHTINSVDRYFHPDGHMETGDLLIGDSKKQIVKDGVIALEGIYEINGNRYLVKNMYVVMNSIEESYEGTEYFCDSDGEIVTYGLSKVLSKTYFLIDGIKQDGVVHKDGKDYFVESNGFNGTLGPYEVETDLGKKYVVVVKDNGEIGYGLIELGDSLYCTDYLGFAMPYGLNNIDGEDYFISQQGKVAKDGIFISESDLYYVDKNYKILKNDIFKVYLNGKNRYVYANEWGVLFKEVSIYDNGNRYFITQYGYSFIPESNSDADRIYKKKSGESLYFNLDGTLVTDAITVTEEGKVLFSNSGGELKHDTVVQYKGDLYYIDTDFTFKKDCLETDSSGNLYYFGLDGKACKDMHLEKDGEFYYFDSNGKAFSNSLFLDKETKRLYYYNSTGKREVPEDGVWRNYNLDAIDGHFLSHQIINVKDFCYAVGENDMCVENGFYVFPHNQNKFYVKDFKVYGKGFYDIEVEGELKTYYVRFDSIVELKDFSVDGKKYTVNPDGSLRLGWLEETKNGTLLKYYFDRALGMVKGAFSINGRNYLFGEDGVLVETSGWNTVTINGKAIKTYIQEDGTIKDGWLKEGNSYYLISNGVAVVDNVAAKGAQSYYFLSDGKLLTKIGWKKTKDNRWVYVQDKNGVLKTGWFSYKNNWYYLDKDRIMVSSEFKKIGSSYYYLDSNGIMKSNCWVKVNNDNEKWVYLNKNGTAKTGWFKYKNKWYYLKPYMYVNALFDYKNNWYIVGTDGVMKDNQWVKLGTDWYFAKKGGALHKGWLKHSNNWYFLAPFMFYSGMNTIDGKSYVFNDSGKLVESSWLKCGTDWVYTDKNGVPRTGWVEYKGSWYYLHPEMETEYLIENEGKSTEKVYVFKPNGEMYDNCWVNMDGDTRETWVFAQKGGAVKRGWLQYKNKWYFLGEDYVMVKDTTVDYNGSRYYIKEDGTMADNEWVTRGGISCYAKKGGKLAYNETIDGKVLEEYYYYTPRE